jgi:sporulation protein YlmC with PRC-barrel domain
MIAKSYFRCRTKINKKGEIMAATKEFQGKLVISSTDGKKLGDIKDVYLDRGLTKITAVSLGKSGIINRKALTIDINDITLIGIDACFTKGSDVIVAKEEGGGPESPILASSLFGREIQTDGGTKIGSIGDVIVDAKCNVLGFSFDRLLVEGPLSETRTIARSAISNLGEGNGPLMASLEQAEKLKLTS